MTYFHINFVLLCFVTFMTSLSFTTRGQHHKPLPDKGFAISCSLDIDLETITLPLSLFFLVFNQTFDMKCHLCTTLPVSTQTLLYSCVSLLWHSLSFKSHNKHLLCLLNILLTDISIQLSQFHHSLASCLK